MPSLKRVKYLRFSSYPAFFCWILLLLSSQSFGQVSSVLSTGNWYKIAVTESGVYKIDAAFLKGMGLDITTIAPDQIKIYGNGGKMLPQNNSSERPVDLVQNAILVKGEEDGKFDASDVIYFYGDSPHQIYYDSLKSRYAHQINIYSDSSYYFFTVSAGKGLRVTNKQSGVSASETNLNQYDDYWFHEKESVNLLRSGREWWGEYIGNSSIFTIQANIPDVIPSSDINFSTSAIGSAQIPTKFTWQLNGQSAGENYVGVIGAGQYDLKAQKSEKVFVIKAAENPGANITLGVNYDRSGQSSAQAYLNYFGLQTQRILKAYGNQQIYRFRPGSKDIVTYQINSVSADWLWWNISDASQITSAILQNTASSATFKDIDGRTDRKYIGFTFQNALLPPSVQKIQNQNLRRNAVPDLLIVTAKMFESEAKRLAAFREENDNLQTLVVTTDQIYNEFSGGKTDVSAVRDYVRFLDKSETGKLKYLLLFGDATYDFKNLLENQTLPQRNNWVPVYESHESLNPVYTYSSDDYFGFLKDGEGEWVENDIGDYAMEIGVGRLPVKSVSDATIIVDKLIHYASSPKSLGRWQNTISFVADDGDDLIHQQHADELAQITQPNFLSSRIFLDAYPQTTTSLGQKVPAVNAAIKNKINDGTLILNYTGHGGTSGWAEEQVLTIGEMQTARGYNNLPLLITATCDFGRYDDPGIISGAELMVLSPRGAAIAALSTTRPVYSSTNFTINKAFYEALIRLGPEAKLGDIFRLTKNNGLAGSLNRNFTLLGDPSMRLARAERQIRWVTKPDTLRAMEKVALQGEVVFNNAADKSFNGTASVTVYDKPVSFRTLGNEGEAESYSEFRNKLFDGKVKITDGQFVCQFVMPKDIDYRTGIGRASFYALSEDSLSDASAQLDVLIGGSVTPVADVTPPKVSAYMNTKDFKDGDLVDASSTLFLDLSDENGINVSKSGIGHNITITLNDTVTYVLNDYYTADFDYRKGAVRFPFDHLPAGQYSAVIKVWDTYTNSSEITFGFQVGLATGIKLNSLNVFPNPFDQDLSFELIHNKADDDVEIVFSILLSSGQKVGSFRWQYYNSESIIRETIPGIRLDGFTSGMNSLLYTMQIRSLNDNSVDKRSGKLLRLR
ncbi:type IX secretion system sortase PorU [Dyadobacter sp. CY345]|uniref:type IX secretion system sortase PorU n=1 Tax=Dyadobacter sp. CY345 TaxID=2909335 RepID=UPI001F44DC1D|nr:type IX secretion system sortase PorU [Dyadobacter sp. CY345]MCF2445452.1 type IX secretion system sortase PorU [Dyadobacter sp. CY345]